MLWNSYCLVRISVIYRGRAVPLVWKVLKHRSSSIAYEVYKDLLDQVPQLLPLNCPLFLWQTVALLIPT